jgi:hypothetical protein
MPIATAGFSAVLAHGGNGIAMSRPVGNCQTHDIEVNHPEQA